MAAMKQTPRTTTLPLSFQNYKMLQMYVQKANKAANNLELDTYLDPIDINDYPNDTKFIRYKRVLGLLYKIIKVGGSFNPRVEFSILKTSKNHHLRLVKLSNVIRLIFPDSSYYQASYYSGDNDELTIFYPKFYVSKSVDLLSQDMKELSLAPKNGKVNKPKGKKSKSAKLNVITQKIGELSLDDESIGLTTDTSSVSSEALSPRTEQASLVSTDVTSPSVEGNEYEKYDEEYPSATLRSAGAKSLTDDMGTYKEIICPSATFTLTAEAKTPLLSEMEL